MPGAHDKEITDNSFNAPAMHWEPPYKTSLT